MLIAVLNGTLSEAEQDTYIRRITSRFPAGTVERITLDVQGDFVDVTYTLHRFRNLRKMGGYCIGEPADWNLAKQAELRDTVTHPVDSD